MPELRQDPATKEWVIIATERARRPDEFRRQLDRADPPAHDRNCPFCRGKEASTPPTVLVRNGFGTVPGADWSVRVFANKFPALTPAGDTQRRTCDGFFRQMDGLGYHEVIVETPIHNRCMHRMEEAQIREIL